MTERAERRPTDVDRHRGPATARRARALAAFLAVTVVAVTALVGIPPASAHPDDVHGSTTSSTTTTVQPGGGVPQITSADSTDDAGGGTNPLWWVLGGVVVVLAVASGIVLVARGRNQGPID
jgi:hypothetical protein